MADSDSIATQECSTCGTLIDVSDEQPLALMHCPSCGAALRVRRTFGNFELVEILGAGGMGSVYRARDTTLDREVALKLLRPEHSQSAELIASFSKEAAVTASINHPNVVKVYTTGTDHGVFYIAMELVDRGSLDELMMLQGRIGEAQLLDVGIQVAQGLNAASKSGLIHRDVKPGNILFADAEHAKIVDFGLAVLQDQANKDGGPVWGTPYYVAPEKLETPPVEDFRSDMYSLGATLFHAAAGRPPFEAETASMVRLKQLKSQLINIHAHVPTLSRTTSRIIDKMLHRFPARRYTSYDELIENLQYARDELAAAVEERERAPKKSSTKWLTLGTAALVVAGGVAAYQQRERFLPKPVVQAATPEPTPSGPSVETLHAQAIDVLAAGRFAEAATALRELDGRNRTPQPRRNWISVHTAIAALLANQPAEAQAALEGLATRTAAPSSGGEEAQTRLFQTTARLATGTAAEPGATVDEPTALLLVGLKKWSAGAFEEAGPLFARGAVATADASNEWAAKLQSFAATLAADVASFQSLKGTPSAEIPALEKAVGAAKELRERQKIDGPFKERVAELDARLNSQLTAAREAKAMREAEMDAADAKVIAEATRGLAPTYAAFRFADGLKVLAGVRCESEARQAELEALVQRTEWLSDFKRMLIADLNAKGYALPVKRRVSEAAPNLVSANDTNASMKTPFGLVPVPWTDIHPDSLVAMAHAFASSAPATELADRLWALGVFLHTNGKKAEARPFLEKAAAEKPEYQAALARYPAE